MINFDTTYTNLPDRFYVRQSGDPAPNPQWLAYNSKLATEMGLPDLHSPAGLDMLSGRTDGIAMAYAGHQFGNFVPQLGDGRALLLGEVMTPLGRRDIQLKGAGRTPFSRGGDGKAWLGPVLREYIMSEAMHALGIPTTRALAAIATGEDIHREGPLPGAILTRVAHSHIRVGTFEYFAAREDIEGLRALLDHTAERNNVNNTPADLLRYVTQAQANLVAQWMAIGFIHGVMNTDNSSISGETIDYGPCAMMEAYHPMQVYSSIDQRGRYAFGNQPHAALWNLSKFASTLLPLMPDVDAGIESFTHIINDFTPSFDAKHLHLMGRKIGIADAGPDHKPLIDTLLQIMQDHRLDYTNTFVHLATIPELAEWRVAWRAHDPDEALMAATNPQVIPRLHLIEAAIQDAVSGDLSTFDALTTALQTPYAPRPTGDPLTQPPRADQAVHRTFCGT